jgi:hypothetical protein
MRVFYQHSFSQATQMPFAIPHQTETFWYLAGVMRQKTQLYKCGGGPAGQCSSGSIGHGYLRLSGPFFGLVDEDSKSALLV